MAKAISILRAAVATTAAAAGTIVEETITTPVNAGSKTAMRIFRVKGSVDNPTLSVDEDENTSVVNRCEVALSARQGLTSVPLWSTPGTICSHRREVAVLAMQDVGGVGTSAISVAAEPAGFEYDFGPEGILVADSRLSLYLRQTQTVNVGTPPAVSGAKSAEIEIEYELITLSDREFIGALSLLETF